VGMSISVVTLLASGTQTGAAFVLGWVQAFVVTTRANQQTT
jgi:hypothetical protein